MKPRGVLAIATQGGRINWQRRASQTNETAFAEDDIRALNDMMREVVQRGTGHEAAASSALRGMTIAGKTGTGDDFVDAWFIGYTADVVMGVWFGNDRPVEMTGLYGGTGPARAFNAVLARLVEYTDLTSADRKLL